MKTRLMSYRAAVADGFAHEMRRDPGVYVAGEEVTKHGVAYGVSGEGLLEEFGPLRIRNTPIIETAIVGHAVGAAAVTYFGLGIPVADATLPVMACSMPFWLAGFWRPKGLVAEKFIPLYLGHMIGDGKLAYSTGFTTESVNLLESLPEKPDRKSRRKAKRKGAELYEPSKAE